jgi:hypothetical protein
MERASGSYWCAIDVQRRFHSWACASSASICVLSATRLPAGLCRRLCPSHPRKHQTPHSRSDSLPTRSTLQWFAGMAARIAHQARRVASAVSTPTLRHIRVPAVERVPAMRGDGSGPGAKAATMVFGSVVAAGLLLGGVPAMADCQAWDTATIGAYSRLSYTMRGREAPLTHQFGALMQVDGDCSVLDSLFCSRCTQMRCTARRIAIRGRLCTTVSAS